ncbi:unnamed protein product [Adineta ricciae]|uniref:G-protein coupled receptors family 1 profile domain-containing protein n=1 Tax=Adineta ricciae TaxID=249248 RepID=A0A814TPF2_ADIRI|nr:unnamed protein product [Adineta ricciae]
MLHMATIQNSPSYSDTSSSMAVVNTPFLLFSYRYGLGLIILLGFFGNLASIMSFSLAAVRVTSTGCLFLVLAAVDTVFLLASTFDFVEVGLVQGPIFLNVYDVVCRFRSFLKGFASFCAAWILVLVTIDRWIWIRYSSKANKWCTHRHIVIGILSTVIITTALHSHMLSPQLFGRLMPGIATSACGSVNPIGSYANFYSSQWPFIQVIFGCLIPISIMLLGSFDIYQNLQKRKSRVQPKFVRQERLNRQMLVLMAVNILIFFATTLPVNVRRILTVYQMSFASESNLQSIVNETGGLTVLLTMNHASTSSTSSTLSEQRRDRNPNYSSEIKTLYHFPHRNAS